ncbi:MAG: hypothetical protein AAFU60_01680 [Bacteroidota bacterium]
MAVMAAGPTVAGGQQPISESGYELIYYPDVNNHALQRAGKDPVFYWLPTRIEIARKNDQEDGDLLFSMTRFAGVQSGESTVGMNEDEKREVAGGILAFTVTAAPPDAVLEETQKKITERFTGSTDHFWGIRGNRKPIFRPVIITSNTTSVSNLSPLSDGSVPAVAEDTEPGNTGNGPRGLVARRGGVESLLRDRGFRNRNKRKSIPFTELPKIKTRSNLDPWFWKMQGEGAGSIDPTGQNAYTALLGAYPTAVLWESFHGAYSPITVQQALQVKFWTPQIELSIQGDWDRIFNHFSTAGSGRYLWFKKDIEAEFNTLRANGDIVVDLKIDETIPNGERIVEMIEKRSDLILQKFMDKAKQIIFDPPVPEVEAAEASGGGGLFGLFGAGVSLKVRRDRTSVNVGYSETRQLAYLQEHVISSSMEGLYDQMQANPEDERKYFTTVFLDDWPRKMARIIKPVGLNGPAVAFLSAQIGYPNTRGQLMWVGRPFQKTDPDDTSWNFGMTQKQESDVANPPADWTSDTTFIKRKVHLLEPPSALEDPYNRVQIASNIIELDEGINGTPTNDITLEVRAEDAERIAVGPISLDVELENARQNVEVTFQAIDENGEDLTDFAPVKFSWGFEDQQTPRSWAIYTEDLSMRSFYKYQVRVTVKGSIFTPGMQWTGPWQNTFGNGPIMVSVPHPESEGVVRVRTYEIPQVEDHPGNPPGDVDTPTPPHREGPPSQELEELEIDHFRYEDESSRETTRRHRPPSGPTSSNETSRNGVPSEGDDGLEIVDFRTD